VRRRARPPQHRLERLALPRAGAAREAALVAVPGRDERGGDRRHPGRNPRGLDRAGRLRSGLRGGGLCERDHHLALHRRAGHVAARRAPRPEARPWRRRRRSRRSDAGDIDVRGLGTAGGVASGAPARAASTLVRRRRRTARAPRPSTISSAHRRHRGRSHAKEFSTAVPASTAYSPPSLHRDARIEHLRGRRHAVAGRGRCRRAAIGRCETARSGICLTCSVRVRAIRATEFSGP
jgi:hypothetical protein